MGPDKNVERNTRFALFVMGLYIATGVLGGLAVFGVFKLILLIFGV